MFYSINNQSFIKLYSQIVGTKSVHTRYTDSGIFRTYKNEKSPKTYSFKAFTSGADETRTRDLLRDRTVNACVF